MQLSMHVARRSSVKPDFVIGWDANRKARYRLFHATALSLELHPLEQEGRVGVAADPFTQLGSVLSAWLMP